MDREYNCQVAGEIEYASKAFCIKCGELGVKNNKVIHPALDKIHAERLSNGFKSTYSNK